MSLQTLGPGDIEPGLPLSSAEAPGIATVYCRLTLKAERGEEVSKLPCLAIPEA